MALAFSVAVLAFFGIGYYRSLSRPQPDRILPIFGPNHADTLRQDGKLVVSQSYHTVPPFRFTNQDNQTVTEVDFKGKIYVTDFFFTTCQGICPKMTKQMERVTQVFKNNPDVRFLSHTVMPETDSVPVLKAYALERAADPKQWQFVTGPKPALYFMARNGYFLTDTKGLGDIDDFVHTENFALVDKEKHLRGFYDGTDSTQVNRLIADINQLLKYYSYTEKK